VFLVSCQFGNPTQMSKWVYEAYNLKEQSSKKIKDRKIVIVSGSNSLFGMNSAMIEEKLKIPVVNDAVHAGLGMPYILYKSKSVLNEGDIAILPLEYSFYQMNSIPSKVFSDYVLARDMNYFSTLSIYEKIKTIYSIDIKRLINGLSFYWKPLTPTKGVYGIQNINDHGDQINIDINKMTKSSSKHLDSLHPDTIKSYQLSKEFVHAMDNYILWAKVNKITLIFMPPNHMYFSYYDSDEYKQFLNEIKTYYLNRNVLYLGKPKNYMYPKEDYFNTAYHLNNIGVNKRTKQLIKDISVVANFQIFKIE